MAKPLTTSNPDEWPSTLSVADAADLMGFSKSAAHRQIRATGEFPEGFPVLRNAKRVRIPTEPLLRRLAGIDALINEMHQLADVQQEIACDPKTPADAAREASTRAMVYRAFDEVVGARGARRSTARRS